MKYKLFFALAALVASVPMDVKGAPKLGVHEWGTFTILAGSDGMPIRWYQPQNSVVELPAFVVRPGLSFKAGPTAKNDYVRMETPVLYFYPEAPMTVDVSVNYAQGRITEIYPSGLGELPKLQPNALNIGINWNDIVAMHWKGDLIPPTDKSVAAKIPKLTGKLGAHYGLSLIHI